MKPLSLIAFLFFSLLIACSKPAQNIHSQESAITDERALNLQRSKESVSKFFQPMRVQDGDWLKSFPESGQTFEEYLRSTPTLPTAERKTIYIQPIGNFTPTQEEILSLTAQYMRAFFNLPVKLEPIRALGEVPIESKRQNPYDKQAQIKTGYFLNEVLPKLIPGDAATFICFTNYDLYPGDEWNYVFGQASLNERVGVWSLSRFGDPEESIENYKLFLSRTLKVAMHETGHMFSMLHCTKYECLMSGSNHLVETDRHPLDVCPECMAKISWAMEYDPAVRYKNLANFWEMQENDTEKRSFLEKEKAIREIME